MEMEQTRSLIAQAQQGDESARSQLVENNLPLVYSIVGRFLERGLEYDDLVQIGSLGLIKAIQDFNLDFEVRFSTYAVPKIIGEIKQQLRQSTTLQIGRGVKKLASEAIATKDKLAQMLGRNPTITEIADFLHAKPEDVVASLDAVAPVFSLQAPLPGSSGEDLTEFQDFIATTTDQEHFLLKQALEKLELHEQQLIFLRYFAEKSQTEVANAFGVSQAQISRLESRIIRQLRQEL